MTKTKTRAAYGGLKMKVEDTGRERPAQDPAGAAKGQAGAGRRARGCDAPQPPPTQVVWWLRVDEIAPSPYQTRAHEADGDLDGLAASIRTSGVINPLTVRRRDGASGRLPWELVAGHRRLAAARLAGLAEVPCLVTEMDDAQARLANVIENLQRKDLGPLEQADGVAALTESGKTAPEIAEMLGVSERWVFRRRKLSALLPEWRGIIAEKGAGQVFCERLAALPRAAQKALLKTDLKKNPDHAFIPSCLWRAGVREVEKMPWAAARPEWCAGCEDAVDGAEIEDGRGFFDDEFLCGDPACLKRKVKKWVDECRAQAARELPPDAPPPIDVESEWHLPYDSRLDKPDVKKGITQAYVVAEGPEAGKVLWGRPPAADGAADGAADEAPEIPGRREELARIRAVQELAREKAERNEGGVSLMAALGMHLVYCWFFEARTRDRRKRLEKAEAEISGPQEEATAFLLGLVADELQPYIDEHHYLFGEEPPVSNWIGEAEWLRETFGITEEEIAARIEKDGAGADGGSRTQGLGGHENDDGLDEDDDRDEDEDEGGGDE